MKKIFSLLLMFLLIRILSIAQSISPDNTQEFCPSTEITFTVTLAGTNSSIMAIGLSGAIVVLPPYNISISGGTTIFNFKGKFSDNNIAQTFRITYSSIGGQQTWDREYKKIKSLFNPALSATCPDINVAQNYYTIPRCVTENISINFQNIPWRTWGEVTPLCFGSITTYEYLLPANWSIGSTVSNGLDWIPDDNSVLVTTDLASTGIMYIYVRPRNSCGSGLTNNWPGLPITINRPEPVMTITPASGSSEICSGCKDFTISGMPSGSTVQWSISGSDASISGSTTSQTVTVCRNTSNTGIETLTATVTHCSPNVYTRTHNVVLGNPYTAWPYVEGPDPECLEMNQPVLYGANYSPLGATLVWGYIEGQYSGTINYVGNGSNGQATITVPNYLQYNTIYVAVENGCGVGVPAMEVFEFTLECGENQEWRGPRRPDTGIENTKFSVSPNPATNKITVSIPPEFISASIIIISDMNGRVIEKVDVRQLKQIFDVSRLPKGIYLIRVVSKTSTRSLKFIKN